MSFELLTQFKSCLEANLSPLKVLLTVSISFSGALGIFCILTLVYPPIEGNALISFASYLMAASAFVICMTHLIVIKWEKKRYTRFNKIMGFSLLISSFAYFGGNVYAICLDCNYPLCDLKIIQFIILPLCISITIFLNQFKTFNKKNREKWLKYRYFLYSFIFLIEGVLNMVELITLQISFGMTYDTLYIAMTSIINGCLGLFSILLIIIFLVTMKVIPENYQTIGVIMIRICLWIIVFWTTCMMIWNIYLFYKMDYVSVYEAAWLVHYGLVCVIALLFGSHDTKSCCIYIGQYEVIPDSSTSREVEHKQDDTNQDPL